MLTRRPPIFVEVNMKAIVFLALLALTACKSDRPNFNADNTVANVEQNTPCPTSEADPHKCLDQN